MIRKLLTLSISAVDFAGKNRVTKNVVDIGCYELQSVGLSLLVR